MPITPITITLPAPGDDIPTGAAKVDAALAVLQGAVNSLVTVASGKSIPPTASFTRTVTGLVVTVDGSNSTAPNGSIVSYDWNWGDSTTHGTGATTTHTYTAAGTYTITLTVTDNLGRGNVVALTVTTTTAPVARFTAAPNSLTVAVNGSSSTDDGTIVAYAWKFGDGGVGSGATASHTYTTGGAYTITLTVTDNTGLTGTATQQVTVSSAAAGLGDGGGTGITPSGTGITSYSNLTGSDFSSRVNSAPSTALVSLPTGTYSFNDFSISAGGGTAVSSYWWGSKVTRQGILGAGSNYTTIEMVPNTSTKASTIPTANGQSNNLNLMDIETAGAKVDGIKLLGTPQGHLYNGLRFTGNASCTLSNSSIVAVPGGGGSPPPETFGVNFQGVSGTVTVTNVTADGQNIAAVGLGSNHATAHFTITNYLAKNCKYSAGWASWHQLGQMDFHGFVVKNSARAFNAEGLGATINFYDPIWDDPFTGHFDLNPTYEVAPFQGGRVNFYFTNTAAWNAFTANRTNKKITAVSNSSSVTNGLVKGTVINVYIGGVLQTQSNYVTWTGI